MEHTKHAAQFSRSFRLTLDNAAVSRFSEDFGRNVPRNTAIETTLGFHVQAFWIPGSHRELNGWISGAEVSEVSEHQVLQEARLPAWFYLYG